MSQLFGRKKPESRKVPVMVADKTSQEAGFAILELDAKEVDELIDRMTKAMPLVRWSNDGLRRNFLSPNSLSLVARRDGVIVGIINGTVSQIPSPVASIGLTAVLDQASGQMGLGGYLVDEFIAVAQKRMPKLPRVEVSLATIDTGSIALYALKGFLIEGFVKGGFSQPSAGQDGADLIILRRHLSQTESLSV
jgi:ribosomal protein S18 acetylase RimI-like enzyme